MRRTMRVRGFVAAACLAAGMGLSLAACGGGSEGSPTVASSLATSDAASEAFARELFDRSNKERVEEGLEPLAWSGCLADKAEERAAPFVDEPDLEHDLLVATCHPGATAGENLSRSDRAAPDVVEAWMNSAGHRANILSPEFLISGVACLAGEDGVRVCAQLFEGVEVSQG